MKNLIWIKDIKNHTPCRGFKVIKKKWIGPFLPWKIKLLKKNKGEIREDKRAILVIKEHFGEVKGHINLSTKALATSPTPPLPPPPFVLPIIPLECSFLDVSRQNKISTFFLGNVFPMGQISWPLNSSKYTLITMGKSFYTLSMQTCISVSKFAQFVSL